MSSLKSVSRFALERLRALRRAVSRHSGGSALLSRAPKDPAGLSGRDWPLHVQLQTQGACNGKCVICPYVDSWNAKNPGHMSDELFEKIITDLEQYEIGKLCLYLQNEPFLDKRWFDRAKTAVSRLSFKVFEVSTNLSVLDADGVEQLADLLKDIPHEIWISFHGVDRASYGRIMGLDYDKAIANLETFTRTAQERGLHYRIHGYGAPFGPVSDAKHLFSKKEYMSFFKRFAAERGLKPLNVHFFKYHDRAGNLVDPDLDLDFRRKSLHGFYCHRIDTWLHIRWNGEIIFCCDDYGTDTVLGDLTSQTIEDYFKSPQYLNYRDMSLGLTDSPDDFICKRCIKPGG